MKNGFKRTLCLLACLTMATSLFAGCNNKDDTSSKASETGSKASDTASKGGADADPTAGIDFGGGTVKEACWVDNTPELGNTERGDAEYYAAEAAKKKYNVGDVEFYVSSGDSVQKEEFTQAALAGEHYADIFVSHSWFYKEYITNDLLQPLTDYVTTYDPEHYDLTSSALYGQVWGICPNYSVVIPNNVFVYNNDILNSLNLESPQTLDKAGKWTWDVFEEYCKKATTLDGVYGVSSFNINEVVMNSAAITTSYFNEKDGKYYNSFTYSDTKDLASSALEFVNRLVNVDKVMLGTFCAGMESKNQMQEAFKDSKLLFSNGAESSWKDEGMDNYSPVQYPLPKAGTKRYQNVNAFTFDSVPASANYPAKDLAYFWMDFKKVWDENAPEDQYYALDYEEKAQDLLASTYNSEEDVQYLIDCGKELGGIMVGAPDENGSSLIWDVFNPVMENSKTVAQVIDETAQSFQKNIDDNLNNFTYTPKAGA